ncbi:hypothetical protein AAY473_000796 [Plecturocebus cupreus]
MPLQQTHLLAIKADVVASVAHGLPQVEQRCSHLGHWFLAPRAGHWFLRDQKPVKEAGDTEGMLWSPWQMKVGTGLNLVTSLWASLRVCAFMAELAASSNCTQVSVSGPENQHPFFGHHLILETTTKRYLLILYNQSENGKWDFVF